MKPRLVTHDGSKGIDAEFEPEGAPAPAAGGSGGGSSHMEQRVSALEAGLREIDGKLEKLIEVVGDFRMKTAERLGGIENRLTAIEKSLESKASSADMRELSVRVSSIPNTWQTLAIMAGLLPGVGGLALTIARLSGP